MNIKRLSNFTDLDTKTLGSITGGDDINRLAYYLGQGARIVWDALENNGKNCFNKK